MNNKWQPCPICKTPNPPHSMRCESCAADLTDPDVLAMMSPGASQSLSQLGEGGQLEADKFLGFGIEGLRDGTGFRSLGAIFGGLLLVAFVMPVVRVPVDIDPDTREFILDSLMTWDVWDARGVSKLAMLLPLILGVLGIGLGFAPKVPTHIRAGAFVVLGLVGVVLCLGSAGELVGTPARAISLLSFGIFVTGAAAAVRVLRPRDKEPRIGLAVGAGLVVLGYLIPLGDFGSIVPGEYHKWAEPLDMDLGASVPLIEMLKGIDRRVPEVLFPDLFMLMPLVAAPLAAWLAWKMPAGPWDKGSMAVRPLAWFLVLIVPMLYGLYAFNSMGFTRGEDAVLIGRVRMAMIATAFVMWIQVAGAALLDAVLEKRAATSA